MSHSYRVSILVVALVVLVAGCGGPGAGVDSPGADTPTTSPTDVAGSDGASGGDTADEDTPTASPSPTFTATPTPTEMQDGRTSLAAALDRNRAARGDVEGYIAQMTFTVEAEQGTLSQVVIVHENLTTGEQFVRLTQTVPGSSLVVEQYEPPDSVVAYQCRIASGECQDQQTILADDVVSLNDSDAAIEQTNLDDLPEFTDEGVVDTEFGKMRLFVAEGIESLPEEDRSGDFGEFTDLRMELYFEEDTGLLRQMVFNGTIETQDGDVLETRMELLYLEFGPVDIKPPDWFDSDE